jgi:hypothetical protein
VDYFLRIEFQHCGSPHAHILLWMDNDSAETLSEDMPRTLQLLTDLCSVDKKDLPHPEMISNQIHAHAFICTKRSEERCRFSMHYCPMLYTRVLMPLKKEDRRREPYKR